jgi:hypothetical protein
MSGCWRVTAIVAVIVATACSCGDITPRALQAHTSTTAPQPSPTTTSAQAPSKAWRHGEVLAVASDAAPPRDQWMAANSGALLNDLAALAYDAHGQTAGAGARLEALVRLAPDAPGRPEVRSILSTLGR